MNKLAKIVNSSQFNYFVVFLIVVNAAILGANTYLPVMKYYGEYLWRVEQVILWLFVIEIALKLIANKGKFFKRTWNIFDAAVVIISLLPNLGVLSVLRSARIFTVLMVISDTPRLRRMMGILTNALPGIASIAAILIVILFGFAVLACSFFGGAFPEWFGNLHLSLFSLFQVMTLEGWVGMVDEIMGVFPAAWVFFVAFIIIATFTVMNLLIAVMVDSLHHVHGQGEEAEIKILKQLQKDIAEIKEGLKK